MAAGNGPRGGTVRMCVSGSAMEHRRPEPCRPHTCTADGRPDRGQGDATEESENCPSQSGSPPLKDVAAAHFLCLGATADASEGI
jgi:hypothetical protein